MGTRRSVETQKLMEISLCDPRKLSPTGPRPKSHSTICLTSPIESPQDDQWSAGAASELTHESHSRRQQPEDVVFTISGVEENRKLVGNRPVPSKPRDLEAESSYEPLCPPMEGEVLEKAVKIPHDNNLSKKARWVIIITAVALVLMSILLVGITLRLAPVIDELVRKENEEILRVLVTPASNQRPEQNHTLPTTTATTTGHPG